MLRQMMSVFSTAFELRGADLPFFSCGRRKKMGDLKKNSSTIEV
jgi:hypothetical protein